LNPFVILHQELERTTDSREKVKIWKKNFKSLDEKERMAVLSVYFGKIGKIGIGSKKLNLWAKESTQIPDWLYEESLRVVGDVSETLSLLIASNPTQKQETFLIDWLNLISEFRFYNEDKTKQLIIEEWAKLNSLECLVFNKLISGSLQLKISESELFQALTEETGIEKVVLAHRISGDWSFQISNYTDLFFEPPSGENQGNPYPFHPLKVLENNKIPTDLESWMAEWKWLGLRCQIIKRNHQVWIWDEDQLLLTDLFPEVKSAAFHLPEGTVLDGEIVGFHSEKIQGYEYLKKRLIRKIPDKKLLQTFPVVFFAFDILENKGQDLRPFPLIERKLILEQVISETEHKTIFIADKIEFQTLEDLEAHRSGMDKKMAEGLVLKLLNSSYSEIPSQSQWLVWKPDLMQAKAVLMYAQKGNQSAHSIFSEFTFGAWNGDHLVPIVRLHLNLEQEEMTQIEKFIKSNTLEKFGPVHTVLPKLVFEISFETISISKRHKSGIVLNSARIVQWHSEKSENEAHDLDFLKSLLN